MSASWCQRWKEAPPTGDGEASSSTSWRSHVESCSTCAARAPLSEDERARVGGPAEARFDQLTLHLTLRRLRQRILDDARRPPVERRRARAGLGARLSAVVLAAVVVICGWPSARDTPAAPSVVTPEGPGGSWSRLVDGDVEVLAFHRGAFAVNVRNHERGRIFVEVPDGEIRDLGTVFRVVVSDEHTEEIVVLDGRVALGVRGAPPVLLVAGDSWRRAAAAVPPPPPTPEPHLRAPKPDTVPPRPARGLSAEDAAYLHVLELVRVGRSTEAQDEARRYLRRFPHGFRSDELQDFARAADGAR